MIADKLGQFDEAVSDTLVILLNELFDGVDEPEPVTVLLFEADVAGFHEYHEFDLIEIFWSKLLYDLAIV